jgi:hypothetical protein
MGAGVGSPEDSTEEVSVREFMIDLLLLCAASVAAGAQTHQVTVRLQDGGTIVARSWFFAYSCVTPLRDNPGLGVSENVQSRDLKLLIGQSERVIPEGLLAALDFAWKTSRPGRLERGKARVLLTTTEKIVEWKLACGSVDLVLPPEGSRREWLRIDLSSKVFGELNSFRPESLVTEVRFAKAPATR